MIARLAVGLVLAAAAAPLASADTGTTPVRTAWYGSGKDAPC